MEEKNKKEKLKSINKLKMENKVPVTVIELLEVINKPVLTSLVNQMLTPMVNIHLRIRYLQNVIRNVECTLLL